MDNARDLSRLPFQLPRTHGTWWHPRNSGRRGAVLGLIILVGTAAYAVAALPAAVVGGRTIKLGWGEGRPEPLDAGRMVE